MSTKVLDIDLSQIPPEITGLQRYSHALVLIRFKGLPVGKVQLPVFDGRIAGPDLRSALFDAAGWPLWEAWLRDYLRLEEVQDPCSAPQRATIAICTRDRPAELALPLESLRPLLDEGQEILVIDNGSKTDQTRRLVKGHPKMRYVREDRLGLNAARNRALREARNDIVAFMDDDALPDIHWHRHLLRNFDDPLVLCVTGLTMPLELETQSQECFERHSPFGRGFKRIVYDSSRCGPASAGKVGAGANMAFRRKVVDWVGPFDEALDGGTPSRSGGDTEMLSRILAAGYRIVYEPAALNWHRHRQTWEELRETLYGYGVGLYAFWTRALLVEGELSVFKASLVWFFRSQLRRVLSSTLKRPGAMPFDLLWAEARGCLWGPWAYLLSRRVHPNVAKEPATGPR